MPFARFRRQQKATHPHLGFFGFSNADGVFSSWIFSRGRGRGLMDSEFLSFVWLYKGINGSQNCVCRLKCSKMCMKA